MESEQKAIGSPGALVWYDYATAALALAGKGLEANYRCRELSA
jgi:hypothetical protein